MESNQSITFIKININIWSTTVLSRSEIADVPPTMWSTLWIWVISYCSPNQHCSGERSKDASHYVIDTAKIWLNSCCSRPDKLKVVVASGVDTLTHCLAPTNVCYGLAELVSSKMCQMTFPGYRPVDLQPILSLTVRALLEPLPRTTTT